MTLGRILLSVTIVTIVAVAFGVAAIVGPDRLRSLRDDWRARLRVGAPYLLLLGAVLLMTRWARTITQDLSWRVGIEITADIYALEGHFIPWLQSMATPPVTAYFSILYVFGYVSLLVFPLVAYLALEDQDHFKTICLAYAFNYGIGLLLYVLFIAYGPRNLLPEVDSLMYSAWPNSQMLTSQVNTNTNVFPSLHASLSFTVVLVAYRTRASYPAWLYLSSAMALSIVIGTLYLGIHWGIDALAGAGLALASLAAADRYDPIGWVWTSFTDPARRVVRRVRDIE